MSTETTDTTTEADVQDETTVTDPTTSTEVEPDGTDDDGVEDGTDEPQDDDTEDTDDEPAARRLKREAATSRRKLREVQTDRDRLAGVVQRFQRAEVERLLDGKLAAPGDLWLDGAVELDDLLDDDGLVDAGKLDEALAGVVERHPNWQYRPPDYREQGGGGWRNRPEPPQGQGAAGLQEAFGSVLGRR